jgi:signal transduction histidine kinase
MKIPVIKFQISNEMDIVLAHKRVAQLCDLTMLGFYAKTAFITAVSEICRNVFEHAGKGKILFNIYADGSQIEAIITDKGKGIDNLDVILGKPHVPGVKGSGLQNSKKLVDYFDITSSASGTTVILGMKINSRIIPVNKNIIHEWVKFFEGETPASPYEELKKQNNQLLELTDQLKLKNMEVADQLEQIKNLNNQLRKSNQELEDFAYTLSHDLRNPIANLKMLISIIDKAGSADTGAYTKNIKKQVERLDNMILGLAEIIDLKNTKKMAPNPVQFADILNVVKDELKSEMKTTGAEIRTDFQKKPDICYYEVHLHSIMQNLITNAIKYRSDDPPRIDISSDIMGDYTVLKFSDNGLGMDLEKIGDKLFKPFTKFTSNTEGKGIGLHIIKGMVEKNNGRIEVQSKPGKGTSFQIFMKEY